MPKNKNTNTKSPLDARYLRLPGQSSDEKIGELQGKSLLWIVVSGVLIAGIFMEWAIALVKIPLEPVFLIFPTIVVAIFVLFSFWKINEIKKEIQNNKLGRDGERAVAVCLENLIRHTGCYIYHSIVCESNEVKFDIDHIIVSTFGLFVIETKTRSKAKGEKVEYFNGQSVKLTGRPPDSRPIEQARRNIKWMRDHMPYDINGKSVTITGIVVYLGWWVGKEIIQNSKDVWVSNEKYLEFAIRDLKLIYTSNEVDVLNDKVKKIPGTMSHIIE